eukprot:TRINITY_DN3092_c0_g1_i1.p1 TRINITY_DN3092_c0_g1~~TRINITY_DN3092_c0_g1_i1.p1  ORF type:complete len:350 (-),score=97.48 TRINITY_DN3092_c0_g1_i1:68-1117(-)
MEVETNTTTTTGEDYSRSVLVTNISPSATNKTVADFFAFCGNISGLTMRTQNGSTENVQEAVIEFSQEAATKTALLLTNALIIDRPITVSRYTGETETTYQNTRVYTESEIDNKPHDLPAGQRSQTSVIASILAAGYQLAAGTLDAAKTYDEKYSVTDQIYAGAASVSKAVSDIDQQYQVSATAASWYKAAADKFAEVDQKYGVSQSTAAAFKTADNAVQSVVQHPSVVSATQSVKDTGAAILEKPLVKDVVGQYNAVVGETKNLIEEQNPAPAQPAYTPVTVIPTTPTDVSSSTTTTTTNTSSNLDVNATLSGPASGEEVSASTPLLATTEVSPAAGMGSSAPLEKKN